ncbi:23S rRNA (cytosine1962-C5)-methyltransferase [Azospirillaceae bacterium]
MSLPSSACGLSVAQRPSVQIMPGRDRRLRSGHPWAFSNEVRMDEATRRLAPGTVARLLGSEGQDLGAVLFHPNTLISARLLGVPGDSPIDRGWFSERLARAMAWRDRLYDRPFYRLIHAEADGLPGLVVDRFDRCVVVQANCAGMDRLLPELLSALEETCAPEIIIARNDSAVRGLEGLPERVEALKGVVGDSHPIVVEENGACFFADPLGGQKTGWFYDQRDNRAFIAGMCGGARVLDLYCYAGGFAVTCARKGAVSVLAVDRSAHALELTARAAAENGVADRCETRRAEAFAELERLASLGERFDVVIADPPAFVKSRKDVAVGSRAYRKLTRLAARVTAPGGFLLMASCSHHIEPAVFAEQTARGLVDAGRTGRILRFAGAAPDHPVHPLLPESAYLKAIVFHLD